MNEKNSAENENNEKKNHFDKFCTHRGEFVPVTADSLKGKKVTAYAEFIEDETEEVVEIPRPKESKKEEK